MPPKRRNEDNTDYTAPKGARTAVGSRGRRSDHYAAPPRAAREDPSTFKKGVVLTSGELVAAAETFGDSLQALKSQGITGNIEYTFKFRRTREPKGKQTVGEDAAPGKDADAKPAGPRPLGVLRKLKSSQMSAEERAAVQLEQDEELEAYRTGRPMFTPEEMEAQKAATEKSNKEKREEYDIVIKEYEAKMRAEEAVANEVAREDTGEEDAAE
ncbi:hypothetical protein BJ170DRAFT_592869 [Xylariales sp. AK1849]|nr:hypothetical protein BJ170DRAFT_592869 [Xylariales sp. AK1849]